jgi:hypothetical protein
MRIRIAILLLLASFATPSALARPAADEPPMFAVVADQRMMAFAAALVLAGYDAPPSSPAVAALRGEVAAALASVEPELKTRLGVVYRKNRRADVPEDVDAMRYRALAFSVTPPPAFSTPLATSQLPRDVAPLAGFAALAGEVYRSPQYRVLLPRLTEAYTAAGQRVAAPAQQAVADTLAYLKTTPIALVQTPAVRDDHGKLVRPPTSRERKVKLFADPLLGGRAVYVRDDVLDAADEPFAQRPGDRFAVFAGDSLDVEDPSLRFALFRFVVAPVVDKNREALDDASANITTILSRNAAASERYANAKLALITDSLVSALGARELVGAKRLTQNGAIDLLGRAQARGEVLAIHFYERLARFEAVGIDFAVYYSDLLHSIDPAAERLRDEQIAAARAALATEPKPSATPAADEAFAKDILEADRLITARRFAEAKPILERILQTSEGNARALFGLAQVIERSPEPGEQAPETEDDERAAIQAERLERAVNLYRRAAINATANERWVASWSRVNAGRILDFLDLRDEAIAEYREAVKLGDVPQGAYREAQSGLKAPFDPSASSPATP